MFDAQTVVVEQGTNVVLYSPWFPRQGDNAVFTLEVAATNASTTTTEVKVFSRANDGTGNEGTQVGSAFSRTSSGRTSTEFSAFNELVRFKYTISSSSGSGWTTFRMLPPVWFDAVKA